MSVLMAVDFGRRRAGIAFSDGLGLMATPWGFLPADNQKELMAELKKLVQEREVSEAIVGLPLHMDGSESQLASEARGFARRLKKACTIPVTLVDERLTSWEAEERLREAGRKPAAKGDIDAAAAAVLLQAELDRRRRENREES